LRFRLGSAPAGSTKVVITANTGASVASRRARSPT
jgi:hypothetical protein